MQPAGARALRGDDNEMSREAVLLQWERKIEAAERSEAEAQERRESALVDPEIEPAEARKSKRFERPAPGEHTAAPSRPALQLVETPPEPEAGRFARSLEPGERRTITISGQPTPPRRRRSVVESQIAQPDRIALWAFLLGLFLVAVAAGTAHA